MNPSGAGRVLAVGMDAAESSLVERMARAGELPTLAALLDRGTWRRVTSSAGYSSGAVWPEFSSGLPACDHGLAGLWNWDPAAMGMAYSDPAGLRAFWQDLAGAGRTVGVIDVPFAPFVGVDRGFELAEWGPHDRVQGRLRVSPPDLADVVRRFPPHPFADALAVPPQQPEEVDRFLRQCLDGVRTRGDLAHRLVTGTAPDVTVVVFPESHHGGHFLWHTVEPGIPMYADLPPAAYPGRTLADVYVEIDRQIGRLIEACGPDTTVLVFALHGMEPSRGVPTVLDPLLEGLGLAALAEQAEGRRSLLSSLKSRVPGPVRDLYRRSIPLSRRSQWGRSGVLPAYDWARTRAFALPIEHEGQIRVNLAGREAQGLVAPEDYDATCDRIEQALRALTTADGRPVTRTVLRPPRGAHPAGLADVVVHWEPAAFESPIVLDGTEIGCMRREQTGQHALDGFCVAAGRGISRSDDGSIAAEDLHLFIAGATTP